MTTTKETKTFRIEFKNAVGDRYQTHIKSISEKGAKQKFSREWKYGEKILNVTKA